jgi:hypothetical protein
MTAAHRAGIHPSTENSPEEIFHNNREVFFCATETPPAHFADVCQQLGLVFGRIHGICPRIIDFCAGKLINAIL